MICTGGPQPSRKTLAPFADRLASLTPAPDFISVVTGPYCLRQAAEHGNALALPPDAWPGAIDWPVSGAVVQVLEIDEADDARVEVLAHALIACGARTVRLIRLGLIGLHYRDTFTAGAP